MKTFIKLFKKVDGIEILKQYWRAHILLFSVIETMLLGFSRKSLEIVRLSADNKILGKMRKKYKGFIEYYKKNNPDDLEHIKSNKVWFCWLQGIENAPGIVKACYSSLKKNLKRNREIILITNENYKDYVLFPEEIQRKIDSGIIKGAHMSDLLRLGLLIKYGGTWIDSTVLCTGSNYPEYLFDSGLFVYQSLKPGLDGHCTCISNWFITAYTNNRILLLTQALLYKYWRENDYLVNYFIFHNMFQLAIETYPDDWEKVVPVSNSTPHILLLRLYKQYDKDIWNAVKQMTCFHKLTYKLNNSEKIKKGTYYDVLFRHKENLTGSGKK